jgi:DNA-binding NtrC family response regulator
MQKVIRIVERVASTEMAILLTGESGTGKELIADLIHIRSGRPRSNILKISCSSLEPKQLEDVYRDTQGGTLLLRDICEMPAYTQGTLLRLLNKQEGKPATDDSGGAPKSRIIAVTNCKPEEAVKKGTLLEELYYRMSAIRLHLPALRDRREDIMPLANDFLKRFAAQANRVIHGFTAAAVDRLTTFDWPGNMTQLQNVIERAVLFSEGDLVSAADLSIASAKAEPSEGTDTSFTLLEEVKRNTIIQTLKETGGNKLETAKRLGIGRQTLYNKIKAYGIEV